MLNNCENMNPFGQLLIFIGSVLAVVICWGRTNSIWVAALAGLFGWLYVFYYAIFIRKNEWYTRY
jgi:positive regulator of sigma E activity